MFASLDDDLDTDIERFIAENEQAIADLRRSRTVKILRCLFWMALVYIFALSIRILM